MQYLVKENFNIKRKIYQVYSPIIQTSQLYLQIFQKVKRMLTGTEEKMRFARKPAPGICSAVGEHIKLSLLDSSYQLFEVKVFVNKTLI